MNLPISSLVPLAVAASLAAPPAPPGSDIELEVLGVVPLESESASVLVLRQKGSATVLPIFVGKNEGTAIDLRLKRAPAGRPLAGDLLDRTIHALGGRVTRVRIEGGDSAVFVARVTLQQAGRRVEVEARPSDSVALAVASRAPIFATRAVLEQAGLTEADLKRADANRRKRAGEDESALGTVQSF